MSKGDNLSSDDRLLIAELLARYSWAYDAGDADGVAALFTAEGAFHGLTGRAEGRQAIRAFVLERAQPAGVRLQHRVASLVITPTGDGQARAKSYVTVLRVTEKPEFLTAGEYDDELVKEDGEWRFLRRRFASWLTKA